MVARPFISLLGAICVLAGATALMTTVSGTTWMGPAIQVVALVWLIGVGCRLLRMHPVVTVLAQTAGVVVTLTAVFTSSGYGGFIPNTRAIREANTLLTGAFDQILHATVPAPATPELGFLIAVTLGLIALVVDFFVAEVDAPALVALPMLCLYSVPASIAEQILPWWTFAIPAACYAALVVVAGHPGRRVGLRAGVGVAMAGTLAVVLAIGGSLLVADSVTSIGTAGRVQRTNAPNESSDIGLSPFASLHGDLQRREAINLLQISNLPEPDYLRTTALETWDPNQGFSLSDPAPGSLVTDGAEININPLANDPAAQTAQISVQVLNFADRFVPIYQGTRQVSGLGDGFMYNASLGAIFRPTPATPRDYMMTVGHGAISPELLRTDTVTPGGVFTENAGVPATAISEAQSITAAGPTAFDKARLLQEYFTDPANGFVYSLTVPTGNTGSLLADFLQNKQGYCEQYATAMAIMLRSIGIPARVAIGFTQGTKTGDGSFRITSHDAHAWVEVRFDNAGWVRFDPTPLSESVGGQQGFATSVDATAPSSGSQTGTADSASAGAGGTAGQATTTATLTDFETVLVPGGTGASTPFWKPAYTWTLVGLAVLSLGSAMPSWWRRRRSRQRLRVAAAGGPDAAAAAWAEVEDLATDHGLAAQSGITVRKAANQLAREGKLTEGARAGLRRIALATESTWYSPTGYVAPADVDLAEDVKRISTDLEHAEPLTVVTRLLPRSLRGSGR